MSDVKFKVAFRVQIYFSKPENHTKSFDNEGLVYPLNDKKRNKKMFFDMLNHKNKVLENRYNQLVIIFLQVNTASKANSTIRRIETCWQSYRQRMPRRFKSQFHDKKD